MKKVVLVCRECAMKRIMECLEIPLRRLLKDESIVAYSGFSEAEVEQVIARESPHFIAFVYPEDMNSSGARALNAANTNPGFLNHIPFVIFLESEVYALRPARKKDELERDRLPRRLSLPERGSPYIEIDDFEPTDPSDNPN